MPTYDYRCDACQHTWDEFHSMTAKPTRKCPSCGKLKAKRLIGPGAGLIFKGSGFYLTDYRSDSYKKGADADKKASETPAKTETKASETKSADTPAPAKTSESKSAGKKGK